MSRFGVWLVESINRFFRPQEIHQYLGEAKLSDAAYQTRDYREAAVITEQFGAHWDVVGKSVLDVGGGLGGKSAFCLDAGAARVVSLDLRMYSTRAAAALIKESYSFERFVPLVSDAAHIPFPDDTFDVIFSVNAFEHLDDVPQTLAECKRVLHPSGKMFLFFPPFYSPWGAHLEGWVHFPWPHVFFSDKTLIQTAQRIEARRGLNQSYIAPAQVDWEHLDCLPELNRITAGQFMRLVKALELNIVNVQMLPFGWQHLHERKIWGNWLLKFLKLLAVLPLSREVVTTKMAFVLAK